MINDRLPPFVGGSLYARLERLDRLELAIAGAGATKLPAAKMALRDELDNFAQWTTVNLARSRAAFDAMHDLADWLEFDTDRPIWSAFRAALLLLDSQPDEEVGWLRGAAHWDLTLLDADDDDAWLRGMTDEHTIATWRPRREEFANADLVVRACLARTTGLHWADAIRKLKYTAVGAWSERDLATRFDQSRAAFREHRDRQWAGIEHSLAEAGIVPAHAVAVKKRHGPKGRYVLPPPPEAKPAGRAYKTLQLKDFMQLPGPSDTANCV